MSSESETTTLNEHEVAEHAALTDLNAPLQELHAPGHDADEQDENTPLLSKSTPDSEEPPFPWSQILSTMLMHFVTPFAFEAIFPFVNQMIVEIGVVDNDRDAGFYSGLIESLFAMVQFIAVIPITRLSDRIGRKPVLVASTLGMGLSLLLFGLAKSLSQLLLTRAVGGAFGGQLTLVRIIINEIATRKQLPIMYIIMTVVYRGGQILGQPIGGTLVHPEEKWDWAKGWWAKHPFALPCVLGCSYAIFASIFGLCFFRETLKRESHEKPLSPSESTSNEALPSKPSKLAKLFAFRQVLTTQLTHILISNALICAVSEALFALYPLFCFVPIEQGGLGLDAASIGKHMAIRSFISLATMFLYTPLERKMGPTLVYRVALISTTFVFASFPALNWSAREWGAHNWRTDVLIGGFFLIWSILGLGWTAIAVLVGDHTPSKRSLGMVNAIFSMSTILPQAVGPAIGTAGFSWAKGSNNYWYGAVVFAFAISLHSLVIKDSDHDWRKEE